MANTEDITLDGISPTGQHEPHYGDEKVVYDDLTLGDYDNASDGNGNSLDVAAIYGFARLLFVEVQALQSGYVAKYDYTNNSIRVYEAGADAAELDEVSQGTTLDIDLRIRVEGTGT